jgi:tRNA-dihydrouridine synthase
MPHMLSYGSIGVDPPLVLAPMAGVTDRQFRLILRRLGGVGLVTMEFVSSEALTRGNTRTVRMMDYCEEERPLSIQIYGSDPQRMAEAARIVESIGADLCDINMGCPANKVLKGCAGCALMGDLDLARRIVATVRKAIRIPLTVKFRAGIRDEGLNYLERLKAALSIPVVGNGDVATPQDALRMLRETGCDGVMIGRASMRNPWIYRQTAALLAGESPDEPTMADRQDLILSHFRLLMEQESDVKFALHKLRTFTGWYTHGLPGGKHLRMQINSLSTPESFVSAVERFFERTPAAA